MLRTTLTLLVLLPVLAFAADSDDVSYLGRPVVEVIDEFRQAGHPFAYSTNLVVAELLVTAEPAATAPLEIVREILRPHGLTIRSEAGVHLVVRISSADLPKGAVLLVVTADASDSPVAAPEVYVKPQLSKSTQLSPGIHEYAEVTPGRYRFDVFAEGFAGVTRVVDVWPGDTTIVNVALDEAQAEIETIAVSASRYEILRELASSKFVLDQRTIQNMPDIGEDPMRVIQRLPGAAASGASAKTHFRGGEHGEIGIRLNGHGLFDPFHIRDYQSVFSAIDARAIEGVEVYTGGFPVRFGDRMSGLVLMESLESLRPRHTEIGISVFNSSFLTAGKEASRSWLFSARRGNLDLVIDKEFGSPSYYDVFGEFNYDISSDATLSVNALFADDRVEVVLESEVEELERVVSRTRNAQLWVQLDNRWSDSLSSQTVLSAVSFDNRRSGSLDDVEKIVATVLDDRDVEQFGFRQDWTWTPSESHLVQWGLEVGYANARYDYANSAEYDGLPALWQDQPEDVALQASAEPDGGSYALYFSDRWMLSPKTIFEWGLRWDDQTYTDLSSDSQLSPRLTLMRSLGPNTELRLSWGRYHQSQGINELQIEDGITSFWPAQRADHYIAGIHHRFGDQYSLRVEAFLKEIDELRPRFENLHDPLGLIPEIQPDRVRLDPTSATSKGVEITVDSSNGPFNWWTTYTYSEATDRINGVDEFRSWDQEHAFQGGITWSNEKWDVALAASVHSGWPTTDLFLIEDGVDDEGEPVFVAMPGARNAERLGSFASVDFRISRTWKLERGSFMAFFEVSNMFNRQNECCRDFDFDEDEDTGEDVFEGDVDYWLGILPAVGVLWEF